MEIHFTMGEEKVRSFVKSYSHVSLYSNSFENSVALNKF